MALSSRSFKIHNQIRWGQRGKNLTQQEKALYSGRLGMEGMTDLTKCN